MSGTVSKYHISKIRFIEDSLHAGFQMVSNLLQIRFTSALNLFQIHVKFVFILAIHTYIFTSTITCKIELKLT